MDTRKRAAIGRTPDTTMGARQSASHDYQHDQNIHLPCLSKDRRYVALDSSIEPERTLSPVSRLGQMPLSSPEEHAIASAGHHSKAYTPLQRWEHENFQEQPWHGIAREQIVDERSGDYISGPQETAEAVVSSPFISDYGRETEERHPAEQDNKETAEAFGI